MILIKIAWILALMTLLGSCASLQDIDQGNTNHPAMDLHGRLTPERTSYLSGLGSSASSTKTESPCTACAH